ncbi:nuclear transport factor 2 family protein [Spirillospora sp. NPDC049652]
MTPKETVVRYVEAVAAGDLAVIVASFADDATWTYPGDTPISGTWKGRDAIVNDFLGGVTAGAFAAPPEVVLTGVVAEGDQVVAEWTARGVTVRGDRYDNRCIGVYTVRDGKIAAVREYCDTKHAEAVLFPPPETR